MTEFGGTITVPKPCKPSKVCTKDFTRPTLQHAYLRKRKDGMWLLATDSYTAVAIKVEGDAVEGWIPIDALKAMEAGKKGTQLSKTAWQIQTDTGKVTYEIADELSDGAATKYPDFEKLADGAIFNGFNGAKREAAPVGFNPTLLSNVAAALGAMKLSLKADIVAPLRPIRLTAIGYDDRVGLQMPVRLIA